MTYFDPRLVVSPNKHIEEGSVKVIYDGGEHRDGDPWSGWSAAKLVWDGEEAVGIRWNGEGKHVGNPQVFGNPMWFILPDPAARLVQLFIDRERKLPDAVAQLVQMLIDRELKSTK